MRDFLGTSLYILEEYLGTIWVYYGNTLGLLQDYLGTTFGRLWDCFALLGDYLFLPFLLGDPFRTTWEHFSITSSNVLITWHTLSDHI